jgi:hypothetical protein
MHVPNNVLYIGSALSLFAALSNIIILSLFSKDFIAINDTISSILFIATNTLNSIILLCIWRMLIRLYYCQTVTNHVDTLHLDIFNNLKGFIFLEMVVCSITQHYYSQLDGPLTWIVTFYYYALQVLLIGFNVYVVLTVLYWFYKICAFDELFSCCTCDCFRYQAIPNPPEFKEAEQTPIDIVIDYNTVNNLHSRTKEDQCGICLQDYKKNHSITIIHSCSHYYHTSCLVAYKQNTSANFYHCPVCRS